MNHCIIAGCLLYRELDLILHRHHSFSTTSFEPRMYPLHLAGVKRVKLGMHVPKDGYKLWYPSRKHRRILSHVVLKQPHILTRPFHLPDYESVGRAQFQDKLDTLLHQTRYRNQHASMTHLCGDQHVL